MRWALPVAVLGGFAVFLTGVIASNALYHASRDAEFAITPTVVGGFLAAFVVWISWLWDNDDD